MTVEQRDFVTFFSPGTLMSETTTRQIYGRDPKLALEMTDFVIHLETGEILERGDDAKYTEYRASKLSKMAGDGF